MCAVWRQRTDVNTYRRILSEETQEFPLIFATNLRNPTNPSRDAFRGFGNLCGWLRRHHPETCALLVFVISKGINQAAIRQPIQRRPYALVRKKSPGSCIPPLIDLDGTMRGIVVECHSDVGDSTAVRRPRRLSHEGRFIGR